MDENTTLRITVTDDQGNLLDMSAVTRTEFADAQSSPTLALVLLNTLQVGV